VLVSLSIRDIVLINRLHLDFSKGLSVLTGETGAGKSILLDSLGLATGARADSGLVRHTSEQGSVLAVLEPSSDHPAHSILHDNDIEPDEGQILLKRTITADGRSRAYINDQPVSVGLLRRVGESLVEVHGQHDDRGLLDISAHRALLDQFGVFTKEQTSVATAFEAARAAIKALSDAEKALEAARADEEWLRHTVDELTALAPADGEEDELAEKRARMMAGEKLSEDLNDMLEDLTKDGGSDAVLRSVLRRMARTDSTEQAILSPALDALDRAAEELNEGIAALEAIQRDMDFEPHILESTEERLFDLRGMARKHKCQVAELPALRDSLQAQLNGVDAGDDIVRELAAKADAAEVTLIAATARLTAARVKAAVGLDSGVMAELPPLKLEKAQFKTVIEQLPREEWSVDGADRVSFEVSTNPGAPFGPMIKIASGGELARFILALKVVLAQKGSAPVLVFDEVDRGIGGATANAVGERLMRLADGAQVLVVTHSPQVAALGVSHFRISKAEGAVNGSKGQTITSVSFLSDEDRREEIARMLSGAEVTDAARAAASQLLGVE